MRIGLAFGELTAEQKDGIEVLVARILEAQVPGPLGSLRPDASVAEMRKALDAVPIPHRIALASRAGAREREILRNDTNPAVLDALARNPSLNAAEALVLLQSHFLGPASLDTFAQDPRWAHHEEIRFAIASHPRVALSIGESIVATLPASSLRKLLQRPGTNALLRERIVRKLARSRPA